MTEDSCKNWIGDEFFNGDRPSESVSMKPLLGKLIQEAFRMAVVDCISGDDARRIAVFRDLYAITEEEWQSIDPGALCKNVKNRLLGTGGWIVRGVYSAHASAREIFDASVANSDVNDADQFGAELQRFLEKAGDEGPDDGDAPR